MIALLEALEASGISMFVKENSTIYVLSLALHAIGLAFVVGISVATSLRILGVAPGLPLAALAPFFPLMYLGLWVTLLSGLVLTIMYPVDYLTEGTLYIKLLFVVLAVVLIKRLDAGLAADPGQYDAPEGAAKARKYAFTVILSWMIVITAGRVMAYSWGTMLQTAIAVIITLALMLGARMLYMRLAGARAGGL